MPWTKEQRTAVTAACRRAMKKGRLSKNGDSSLVFERYEAETDGVRVVLEKRERKIRQYRVFFLITVHDREGTKLLDAAFTEDPETGAPPDRLTACETARLLNIFAREAEAAP